MSLARTFHMGCAIPPKTPLSLVVGPYNSRRNGITTTGGKPPRPHSLHLPHLSLISSHPFHPGGAQDRCCAIYLPTLSHSSKPHGPTSLVPLFSPPRRSAHFNTAEVLAVKDDLGGTTLSFINVYIAPASFCPRI